MDVAVVIPVFNQAHHTRTCLAGLQTDGIADSHIVVVDNCSTDDTAEVLASRPELRVIRNANNKGCSGAWNQGVRALPATWTVILNNDVLIPPGWLAGLVSFGEEARMDVVSPAICEGDTDYDFPGYARQFMIRMARAKRVGVAAGCGFMVHRRVFDAVGLFDDDPRLGGYEDDEFFRRAREAGFGVALTGRSFMHHFGSVTQKAIQVSRKQPNLSLGDRAYYHKKHGLTWFKRRRLRLRSDFLKKWWRWSERARYGCTLRSCRRGGVVIWQ